MSAILPHHFHTWCGLSANLECMSEMCGTRLTENAGPKKVAKNCHLVWAPSHNFVGLYLCNQGMYRKSEKNLLSSNMSSSFSANALYIISAKLFLGWSLVWKILVGQGITERSGKYPGFDRKAGKGHGNIWDMENGISSSWNFSTWTRPLLRWTE